jgi:hypothetical protein
MSSLCPPPIPTKPDHLSPSLPSPLPERAVEQQQRGREGQEREADGREGESVVKNNTDRSRRRRRGRRTGRREGGAGDGARNKADN